ncbi:hypothetical protein GCM10027605_41760 [Micromonospora zhanjiangensis]
MFSIGEWPANPIEALDTSRHSVDRRSISWSFVNGSRDPRDGDGRTQGRDRVSQVDLPRGTDHRDHSEVGPSAGPPKASFQSFGRDVRSLAQLGAEQ